uniref:TSC22 domain family protein 1 n=1 Tax=Terrapene triunguis TaxID=2587831 RepID=A0A674JU33_9SAUR
MIDLVKSHLMFAVREEVEVLREQIKELAERNAALEWENGLLRSLASPEQLAQPKIPAPVAPCCPLRPRPRQLERERIQQSPWVTAPLHFLS